MLPRGAANVPKRPPRETSPPPAGAAQNNESQPPPGFRGYHEEDFEAILEQRLKQGACFRYIFFAVLIGLVLLLLVMKWDKEHLVPPNEAKMSKTPANDTKEEENLTEKYYSMLNIRKEDERNVLERVEEEYEKLTKAMDPKSNPDCGEDCSRQLVELKKAYNALTTQVVHPYHEVLNIPRNAPTHKIRKAYEKAKAEAEKGNSKYPLAELKEAYDIMSNPDTRDYYSLYGTKPPVGMKHRLRNNNGGWGVDVGVGTFKYTIIQAWLSYFNNIWVDIGFFAVIIIAIGVKMWNHKDELLQRMAEIEAMEEMLRNAAAAKNK